MSTSTVEKSGLWISLASLFRPVTSSLQELSLSGQSSSEIADALSPATRNFPNSRTIRQRSP